MSHFTVLVIGENQEEQLQPFHEYECTGQKDQYVIDVDYTEEVNEWLEKPLFVGKKKDSDEIDYHYYEDKAKEEFESYETMTHRQYFEKTGADFDEEISENFGVEKKNGVWSRFTNPNAKWDWYQLGGRWTGFFKLKNGAQGNTGEPGLMTRSAKVGYADEALKKDIDFEGMRNEAANKAAERYDSAMSVLGNLPVNEPWDELRDRFEKEGKTIEEARTAYWAQERCVASRGSNVESLKWDSPDSFLISREQYIENARKSAISTFAVIKDGKWYEKGEMGWWGMVSNEKDKNEWLNQYYELLESIPDDTMISVYDCHI